MNDIRQLILEWAGEVHECQLCDEWPCHYHCTMLDAILASQFIRRENK